MCGPALCEGGEVGHPLARAAVRVLVPCSGELALAPRVYGRSLVPLSAYFARQ
jgi:hypothetical protein